MVEEELAVQKKYKSFYDAQYTGEDYASDFYAHSAIKALKQFVNENGLTDVSTLDIGCGRGLYQDVVPNWTGLDISHEAGKYTRKKFACGSADKLPFNSSSFKLIWSITFLEHAPEPEKVLEEIARVLDDGGVLYLSPAWRVPPWRPMGYEVKAFQDLSIPGKFIKLFIPLLNHLWMKGIYRIPYRLFRELVYWLKGKSTHLAFTSFTPNMDEFLLPDSDACSSIDIHETLRWLISRGFVLLDHKTLLERVMIKSGPIIVCKGQLA